MRQKSLKLFGVLSIGIFAGTAYARHTPTPYIGIEAIQTNQSYAKLSGKKVFRQNTQNYALFTGFNFTPYIGMEIGFEMLPKRTKVTTLVAGDGLSGQSYPTGTGYIITKSDIRGNSPYIGMVLNYTYKRSRFDMMLGAAFSYVKARSGILNTNGTDSSTAVYNASIRNYSNTKVVPMVKLSATQCVAKYVGVRFSLNYKNMERFYIVSKQTNDSSLKLYDQFGVGLGLVFSIY